MPRKVKSFSPPWLSHGTAGAGLFEPAADGSREKAAASPTKSGRDRDGLPGPRRTVAHRATQVFVAVGKDVRWGDLAYLKERYEETPQIKLERSPERDVRAGAGGSGGSGGAYIGGVTDDPPGRGIRVLKIPVADEIRQLVISHNGSYLAVMTTHTVHICLIPDSSHLSSTDSDPIRPKFWTLGPTTHVTSRSALASVAWHPLGVNGSCLATVTRDAVVRLWELSPTDLWSFDKPTVSIDLKKLIDGTYLDQDYTASAAAASARMFSPDAVEMEVAAAAFPSRGSGDWSPMTLWIAMREGDIYALCPLLPGRWAPPPTLIPSLSVSVVTKLASLEDDPDASEQAKLLAQNQIEWISEVDNQEPQKGETPLGEAPVEIYTRPSRPALTPLLQGPFELKCSPVSDDELDTGITDILVIGKKLQTDDLMMGEENEVELDDDDLDREGLSLTVVCVLSVSGQVRVYLDTDGVEAQWLPPRKPTDSEEGGGSSRSSRLARLDSFSLLAVQCVDTMFPSEVTETGWPLFSPDVNSRYDFYVSHHAGITIVALSPWLLRLEIELENQSEAGSDFRLGLFAGSNGGRRRLCPGGSATPASTPVPMAAPVVISDPDIGYFLLSATPYEPVALTLEEPAIGGGGMMLLLPSPAPPYETTTPHQLYEETPDGPLVFYNPRPAYVPSHILDQPTALPTLMASLRSSRHQIMTNQEVRLSAHTLRIFTEAHSLLSDETHRLGVAVSEVFRRCAQLQRDLKDQIVIVGQVKARVDRITGRCGQGADESAEATIQKRISAVVEKQDALTARMEKMRAAVSKGVQRPLSDKEGAFADEVRSLEIAVLDGGKKKRAVAAAAAAAAAGGSVTGPPSGRQDAAMRAWTRLEHVRRLHLELAEEAGRLIKRQSHDQSHGRAHGRAQTESGSGEGGEEGEEKKTIKKEEAVTALTLSPRASASVRVPSEIKKAKIQQVLGLLNRETALVEAVSSRLERLQLGNL